jgi:hypothetical protein
MAAGLDEAVKDEPAAAANTSFPRGDGSNPITPQMENADAGLPEPSYGTRSRNRTNARPNYSEEQDMDFEFLAPATTTTATTATNGRKKASDTSVSVGQSHSDVKRTVEPADVAQNASSSTPVSATGKDSTINSSTGNASNPKKRKAAAAATAQSVSAVATSLPTANGKKSIPSAASLAGRETNLMSFIKHKHCLNKKGELVADDGTRLSVNGKSLPQFYQTSVRRAGGIFEIPRLTPLRAQYITCSKANADSV